jgi:hypothetical protein
MFLTSTIGRSLLVDILCTHVVGVFSNFLLFHDLGFSGERKRLSYFTVYVRNIS